MTPLPNGDRTEEVIVSQQILQSLGIRSFTPQVTACPGCGRTTSTFFQEMADEIQTYLRDQMPKWKATHPGVETMKVAVMGCVVNGPGESKHSNIGISLPGTFEEPKAPVYVDGRLMLTLKGDRIVAGVHRDPEHLRDDALRAVGAATRSAIIEAPMPKRFTLAEAQALIPRVDRLLRNAIERKTTYEETEREIHSFPGTRDDDGRRGGGSRPRARFAQPARTAPRRELRSAIEEVQEIGCLIKDLDIGLIDFPTTYHGNEVYLCWKLGESGIEYWHGVDEGFRGRKPIDQDFLDNHEGDRSQ